MIKKGSGTRPEIILMSFWSAKRDRIHEQALWTLSVILRIPSRVTVLSYTTVSNKALGC